MVFATAMGTQEPAGPGQSLVLLQEPMEAAGCSGVAGAHQHQLIGRSSEGSHTKDQRHRETDIQRQIKRLKHIYCLVKSWPWGDKLKSLTDLAGVNREGRNYCREYKGHHHKG